MVITSLQLNLKYLGLSSWALYQLGLTWRCSSHLLDYLEGVYHHKKTLPSKDNKRSTSMLYWLAGWTLIWTLNSTWARGTKMSRMNDFWLFRVMLEDLDLPLFPSSLVLFATTVDVFHWRKWHSMLDGDESLYRCIYLTIFLHLWFLFGVLLNPFFVLLLTISFAVPIPANITCENMNKY